MIRLAFAKFSLIDSHSSIDERSSITMRHFCLCRSLVRFWINSGSSMVLILFFSCCVPLANAGSS
uniref:Uncharacterized protein n=1 Tax=Arundo donax TaxID=35708 RepID=A0A0A9G0E0_ARUDO